MSSRDVIIVVSSRDVIIVVSRRDVIVVSRRDVITLVPSRDVIVPGPPLARNGRFVCNAKHEKRIFLLKR